ncbi:MAG: TolC family protein [Gemmatimonadota bacterium]
MTIYGVREGCVRARRAAGLVLTIAMLGAPTVTGAQEVPEAAGPDEQSYTLDRAVDIALRNNRELHVAELDLATAEKQVGEAYGGLFPEINANASYQRNLTVPEAFLPAAIFDPDASPDDLVPVRFGADNQWQAGIDVNQPLFDASVFIGVSTAGKFREFSRESLRGAAQQIATDVRVAYLDVLLAEERVRLTTNSVARVEQTLDEARAMYRVGLLGEYDVLRLEVELANIEPELRRSRDRLVEARRNLAIEMGLPDAVPVRAEGSLASVDPSDLDANTPANRLILTFNGVDDPERLGAAPLVERAAAGRSDVRQLALRRELEEVRVGVAKSELLPTAEAFFNYSLSAQENGGLNFFGENDMQRTTASAVGVRVTVPVFSGLRRYNRVAQRQIEVRQVESRLAELRLRAESDVRTRADQVGEADARATAQRQAVAEARRGFEIASSQYREGTGSRLEVTDAELALRQSELNYARAVYDYLTARARLDLAVGQVPRVDAALDAMFERPGARRSDDTNTELNDERRELR